MILSTTTRFALTILALGAVACAPTAGSNEDIDAIPTLDDETGDADTQDDGAAGDDDDSAAEDDPVGDDDDSVPGDDDDSVPGDDDDDDSTPAGVCPDDVHEDNDEINAAVQLGAGLQAGLTSCTDDEDWFGVQVPAGEQLSVALTFLDDEGDIDVTVTDASGTWLAGSSSTTDDELAGPVASETGEWMFVKVRLFGDAGAVAGNDYDLELSVGAAPPPEVCPADAFEENDDQAAAVSLPTGSHAALVVCSEDTDWYALPVTAGQTVSASALFPHAEGDVDLALYDADAGWLASSTSVTDDEALTWAAADAGTVYLRVTLYSDSGAAIGNDYTLDVAVQ